MKKYRSSFIMSLILLGISLILYFLDNQNSDALEQGLLFFAVLSILIGWLLHERRQKAVRIELDQPIGIIKDPEQAIYLPRTKLFINCGLMLLFYSVIYYIVLKLT